MSITSKARRDKKAEARKRALKATGYKRPSLSRGMIAVLMTGRSPFGAGMRSEKILKKK